MILVYSQLCSYQTHPAVGHFHPLQRHLTYPQPRSNPNRVPDLSIDQPLLRIPEKCNPAMFCLLCLATFTSQDAWGSPASQTTSIFSFLAAKQRSMHGCPAIRLLRSESLWFDLTTIYHAAINIGEALLGTCFHFSWSQSPWSRHARTYGKSGFNILKKYQTVFESACTVLKSYWQCIKVQTSPHLIPISAAASYWPELCIALS